MLPSIVRSVASVIPTAALALALLWLASCAHLAGSGRDEQKARLYLQLAVDQLNNAQYSKAIESTQKAIELDPGYAPAYNHLALVYMETKRYDKAEAAFQRALELKPDYPEVFNNLGVLLNRREKFRPAIAQFEKALADDKYPTPENALTNMGFSYYKLGELSRAKVYHQKALDLVPNFCLAQKNLGDVYAKEKNFGKATDYYRGAVTHCPLFQEAHYKLGLALMKTGQRKVARHELERLVNRHKTGPYVQRSNEVLKFLQ